MSLPLLTLKRIEKSFGGERALKSVDLSVDAGEIVGLVGENGAGKSTLIKIASGVHRADAGVMEWLGQEVRFASPQDALKAGIATIHQELAYFGRMSVAENLLMGTAWPRHRWGGLDWRKIHAVARRQLSRFGLDIDPRVTFDRLRSAEKQEVAIARALSREARLLILDEPTASLSGMDAERLLERLRKFRDEGVGMLYISHRLDEVLALTDRIVVLRDGRVAGTHTTAGMTIDELISEMVGRPLEQVYPRSRKRRSVKGALEGRGEMVLELCGASKAGMFEAVDLRVEAGEVVGLAGLIGAGRSELARAVIGLYPLDAGTMRFCGRAWAPVGAAEAVRAGVVYLPEERKRQGLVMDHSIREAVSIGFTDLLARWGMIPGGKERAWSLRALKGGMVKMSDMEQSVSTLSGGNQQKTMFARWLERDSALIIFDEPTRGVDVGAKAEIHGVIDRLAASGKAVLLISSDISEVLGMSDRVVVLNRGRVAAELGAEGLTRENLLRAVAGLEFGREATSGKELKEAD